jgi:hypothetical protein
MSAPDLAPSDTSNALGLQLRPTLILYQSLLRSSASSVSLSMTPHPMYFQRCMP